MNYLMMLEGRTLGEDEMVLFPPGLESGVPLKIFFKKTKIL